MIIDTSDCRLLGTIRERQGSDNPVVAAHPMPLRLRRLIDSKLAEPIRFITGQDTCEGRLRLTPAGEEALTTTLPHLRTNLDRDNKGVAFGRLGFHRREPMFEKLPPRICVLYMNECARNMRTVLQAEHQLQYDTLVNNIAALVVSPSTTTATACIAAARNIRFPENLTISQQLTYHLMAWVITHPASDLAAMSMTLRPSLSRIAEVVAERSASIADEIGLEYAQWNWNYHSYLGAKPIVWSPNWNTETAVALAQTIFRELKFDLMPILADALDDACCNPKITARLRQPGVFTRADNALCQLLGIN